VSTSAEPEWLNPQEMAAWLGYVELSTRLTGQLNAARKAEGNITFDDYEVLGHLSQTPDPRLRMTELADILMHSRSRSTQRVDRLVKRGLVIREKCEDDGRGTWAVLTAEGMATIERLAPGHLQAVRERFIDHLTGDDLATWTALTDRVNKHLRER